MITRASFWVAGSQMIKTVNLSTSVTKLGVALKQRPDRFPFIGDLIQVTATLEHTWVTPRHTVIESY